MIFLAKAATVLGADIHEEARDGHLQQVEQLVGREPALVTSRDEHQFTPLHWAAANGHADVMKFLLAHGADPDAASDRSMTPLLLVKDGREELLTLLVDHGANVRAKGEGRWTALHLTAQRGSLDGTAYLLARGLDVNARCEGPFGTPLLMAAANGQTQVARLLLANGAEVNVRTDEGLTPLLEAVSRGHTDVVELLLWRQADANARTSVGRTALHMAPRKGGAKMVRLLVDHGADPGAFSDAGLTPLHEMVIDGDGESVGILLARGAHVNVRSKPSSRPHLESAKGPGPPRPSGNTPLHFAVLAEREAMVALLLSRRADVNARNSLGETPLRLAKSDAIAKLLRDAGSKDQ